MLNSIFFLSLGVRAPRVFSPGLGYLRILAGSINAQRPKGHCGAFYDTDHSIPKGGHHETLVQILSSHGRLGDKIVSTNRNLHQFF